MHISSLFAEPPSDVAPIRAHKSTLAVVHLLQRAPLLLCQFDMWIRAQSIPEVEHIGRFMHRPLTLNDLMYIQLYELLIWSSEATAHTDVRTLPWVNRSLFTLSFEYIDFTRQKKTPPFPYKGIKAGTPCPVIVMCLIRTAADTSDMFQWCSVLSGLFKGYPDMNWLLTCYTTWRVSNAKSTCMQYVNLYINRLYPCHKLMYIQLLCIVHISTSHVSISTASRGHIDNNSCSLFNAAADNCLHWYWLSSPSFLRWCYTQSDDLQHNFQEEKKPQKILTTEKLLSVYN